MGKLALNGADKWTDNTLDEIVDHLDSVYKTAYSEMTEERRKSFSAFQKSDKKKLKELNDGKITKEEYKMWRIGWLNSDLRMRTLIDDYAQKITETNAIASDYINGVTPEIYAYNHNFTAYEFEKNSGIAFTIVDKNTVKELATGKNHSEFKVLSTNPVRDYNWNRDKIQKALTSGIVQGKSIPEIANDFYKIMGSNKKSAVRNARTAVTSAQNGGRQRGFEQAHDSGIKFKKEWLSAHDGRVRDSHAHLDGIQVEYDEKFPNGLMYPADPQGAPSEVYNCRCTLIADVLGMRGKRTSNTTSSYKEWVQSKSGITKDKGYSQAYMNFKQVAQEWGIEYNPAQKLEQALSKEQIIDKISGGDETKGSCVSQVLCYIGNRLGYNVEDYRGGLSRILFAKKKTNRLLSEMNGIVGYKKEITREVKETLQEMAKMEPMKEYAMFTGCHCSVVRKLSDGTYEYLELQSKYGKYSEKNLDGNGWKPFDIYGSNEMTLRRRFGCAVYKRKNHSSSIQIIDIEECKTSSDVVDMLGYINTSKGSQFKGANGGIK